jgi:hypothetical protein
MRIIAFLLLFQTALQAQNVDTNYIAQHPFKGNIYYYITTKNNELSFQNTITKYTLTYSPNSWGSQGVGFSYQWFDISVGLISYGKRDEKLYGKTTRFDFQSHLYLRKYIIDIFIQNYNGFYSTSGIVTPSKTQIYKRNDISMTQIGGNLIYLFNYSRFSTKAAYSQSEIQRKRVGTWALGSKINIIGIDCDSSFTSPLLDSIFKPDYRFNKFTALQVGVLGGYLQNWVYKNWTFSGTFLFGFANQIHFKQLASDVNKTFAHSTTGFINNFRLGVGYSKNSFYFLLSGVTDNCSYPFDNEHKLNHSFGRVDVTLGYRIFKKKD